MKEIWVIKTGGELWSREKGPHRLLRDLRKLVRTKKVVVVHGGGPQIAAALKSRRIPVRFVSGRRVTSADGMPVVEQVLSGTVNKEIVSHLNSRGIHAAGLSGRDGGLLQGKRLPRLGRAAEPTRIRPRILQSLLKEGWTPVVATVGSDKSGRPVNINADDAASALAGAVSANRLIFLTDVKGVQDSRRKRIPVLHKKEARDLIRKGVISGGMIPKIQSALAALQTGVGEVDILYGTAGLDFESGTRIIK